MPERGVPEAEEVAPSGGRIGYSALVLEHVGVGDWVVRGSIGWTAAREPTGPSVWPWAGGVLVGWQWAGRRNGFPARHEQQNGHLTHKCAHDDNATERISTEIVVHRTIRGPLRSPQNILVPQQCPKAKSQGQVAMTCCLTLPGRALPARPAEVLASIWHHVLSQLPQLAR